MVTESVLNQFISEAMANVDVAIIIALMGIGFCIKHLRFFEKISNDLIPPTLIVSSLVLTFMQNGINIQAVITAVVSAATAIGLHQQGKNIFNLILPATTSSIDSHLVNNEAIPEEQFEVEETDEVVEE